MTFHTIKVSKNPKFRQCLAQAIMAEARPGYLDNFHGRHYADPVAGIVYLGKDDQPWDDDAKSHIVPVSNFVFDTSEYSGVVDWDSTEFPYADMLSAFLVSNEHEPFEPTRYELIQFAHGNGWENLIEDIEDEARNQTMARLLGEILDEVAIRS